MSSFYVQNIRNNENKARTPKWVRKAGLVDPAEENRRIAKSQWKKRYDERNNISTHVGAELEEGEEGGNYAPIDPREEERRARLRNEGLWTGDDETYYNEGEYNGSLVKFRFRRGTLDIARGGSRGALGCRRILDPGRLEI